MKNILIITGSYPPDFCGVADAVQKIVNTETGKTWEVYYRRNWNIFSVFKHIKDISSSKIKYILLEYPTQGYGLSLVPHLLCIYFSLFTHKRFGVIIHEQSHLSLRAYLALLLILVSANRIIFTTQFERNYAIKRIPFMANRSTVVKIVSNISPAKNIRSILERSIDIAYFGFISPKKGIERFIKDTAHLSNKYKISIVGQVQPIFTEYYKNLLKLCKNTNIHIQTNLSETDVSDFLNNTKVAYLPFPDGVSERRGSLLAFMANGAGIVTTVGKYTTPALMEAVVDVSKSPLENILLNKELLISMQNATQLYMHTQIPHGWDEVTYSYQQFLINT
jgi:glycosyltransferase involved in cell wall biosynthesis